MVFLLVARYAACIIVAVLGLTYLAIIAVALFHPDKRRRSDARALLSHHLLTKKQTGRSTRRK